MAAALCAVLDPATTAELCQLRAANRRQVQELAILKTSRCQRLLKALAPTDAGPMSRYRFVDAERRHYPVRRLCQALGAPAGGFCAGQQGQQKAVRETALVKVFGIHQRRYGTRWL